ncbi:23S rRNA (adenine(2030)-N(6))-methyltransferase RlmJ [Acuticoccus mangrovi]|uniref:Ribosomal RNA large subunit methyltransferase J n=1 Tax=Acuticoccus mangrovi TaxID=2796142 RepID=A0A934IL46_9HYPH|nr:23S rRNA (adenine(2030)-N(6))-methyltransferase RlmJ [Acuticoccus mangrovi]MBJ3775802.1 23S rRNA (adenine(2030)-N(6))-methyltransferase RlmJ [Acuticoccus mangrovi]
MNYRHVYHAGNFADVLKHAVLARLVDYLKRKPKPFRVIDTHAGVGLYDLSSEAAQKTGEWRGGIGRLIEAPLPADAAALLAPYLDIVAEINEGPLTRYPGSPLLVRMLLRREDRLSAIELHPEDYERLAALFAGDRQTRVTRLDGWLALGAHVPPKERRGLVLVDPPFELAGEYERMVDGLVAAHKRFQSGLYCLWYPRKAGAPVADFHRRLRRSGIGDILVAELDVRSESAPGLAGSGVVVVNPPYVLEGELATLLPVLADRLGEDASAAHRLFRLAGED